MSEQEIKLNQGEIVLNDLTTMGSSATIRKSLVSLLPQTLRWLLELIDEANREWQPLDPPIPGFRDPKAEWRRKLEAGPQ